MNILTAAQLREKFLHFFESKGHKIIPSASVVPQNDPSVLFTTAGMQPLVPFLQGEKHVQGARLVNVQKCIRTTDIEEVGDNRHLTIFEMLGNWSLGGPEVGGYSKDESIAWSFEFLTGKEYLDLDPEHIYVSVFSGDQDVPKDTQAIAAWQKAFASFTAAPIEAKVASDIYEFNGKNKIFLYGREKNWWQAGDLGPAGPDTEMFVDTEGGLPNDLVVKHDKWLKTSGSKEKCHVNCDCGRFIEIWNNVFMQHNGLGAGKYEPLKQQNIDTGMGLDRVLTYLHGQQTPYDTELFKPALEIILSQVPIETNEQEIKARIIVDHLRASTFMVADGVVPDNKQRGYILRRLLRRAMVHGKILGLKNNWVEKIVSQYINQYGQAYPELASGKENILKVILEEEQKFGKTLEAGLKEFNKLLNKGENKSQNFIAPSYPPKDPKKTSTYTNNVIYPKDAFDLYQTHGFPLEQINELLAPHALFIEPKEFEEEFKKHQDLSRTASAGTFKGGLADHSEKVVRLHTATHLMQAALRRVLGPEVFQKGSNITTERTRFDFTYSGKVTSEQIKEIENIVNENIQKDLIVRKDIMTPDEARKLGAIGLFGEKYGDSVSIYTIIDKDGTVYSREFCGGPHVEHTGVIGKFKIQKEEAVSAGVRRLKATIE